MSDPYACLTCGECHPGPCLPPVLPTPEAMRDILKVTVHAGECAKVMWAYADGRLIDGQQIFDAWQRFQQATYPDSTGEWNEFCREMDALKGNNDE